MRKKIQRSMVLVIFTTLLISYGLLTLVVYHQTMTILKQEVNQEAAYIRKAINLLGDSYLEDMDEVDISTRVTVIDEGGQVHYDSRRDAESLENHMDRPEIQAALRDGYGENVRISGTVGKEMYYYALLLADGNVLRVSKTVDNLASTAWNIFPVMFGLGVLMLFLAWFFAKWQTARLIVPINAVDVEHPLDAPIYEELTPFMEAIDRQNKEKDAVANMRKEFSANVSHELKTPLTSISGYAEIIKNGMVRQEDIPEFADRIYKEARRLIHLIEDIIKLSKLDEESVELEKEEVDLYNLTRDICTRLAPQAAEKKVHIEVQGERVNYRGIRQILDEMIYNICENAIKYNVENGKVNVWVGNTLDGPKVLVEDTGIGIPQEHQERVFERFYRVDKSHSKARGGTGLGLSIVKHGALLHHAEVTVESKDGAGSKITLKFPK